MHRVKTIAVGTITVGVAIVIALAVMAFLAVLHWVIPVIVAVVVIVGGGYLWHKAHKLEKEAAKYEAEHHRAGHRRH